jgi:hypothetical protein
VVTFLYALAIAAAVVGAVLVGLFFFGRWE